MHAIVFQFVRQNQQCYKLGQVLEAFAFQFQLNITHSYTFYIVCGEG